MSKRGNKTKGGQEIREAYLRLISCVKAPRTFDGVTCTKVNWGRVSMKESSNKVELDLKREREV